LYFDQGILSAHEFRKVPGKQTRASTSKFTLISSDSPIPTNCIPATAYRAGDTAFVTGLGILKAQINVTSNSNWILQNVQFPHNLKQELNKPRLDIQAVSDGSFKDRYGTAAWTVVINGCTVTGKCVVPGNPEDQSAYRSELTGLYGIVYTIWHIQMEHKATGRVTVGCDGLSALRQAKLRTDFINPNIPQYDLILAIRTIIEKTTWQWEWIHVKGHQDDILQEDDLDTWSRLNIQMDAIAKEWWVASDKQYIDPIIMGEPWRTEIGGKKIASNLRATLREACSTPKALEYWATKKRFGSGGPSAIDWEAFGGAMQASQINKQHWVSKTISGFCATGIMMKRRRERLSDSCPRCGEPENVQHIWQCRHDTDDLWKRSMEDVRNWLSLQNTHPEMTRVILESLNRWRSGEIPAATTHIKWLQDLVNKQNESGWHNFFEGMLVKDWRKAMVQYLERTRSKKSSKRWTAALIRKLWQVAWDLWEHRNGFLHESEDNLISNQTNNEIQEQFRAGCHELDRQSQALFARGADSILRKPLEVRQQWLRRVKVARSRTQTQGGFAPERRMMAKWLKNEGGNRTVD
jgi:hypothetical protein